MLYTYKYGDVDSSSLNTCECMVYKVTLYQLIYYVNHDGVIGKCYSKRFVLVCIPQSCFHSRNQLPFLMQLQFWWARSHLAVVAFTTQCDGRSEAIHATSIISERLYILFYTKHIFHTSSTSLDSFRCINILHIIHRYYSTKCEPTTFWHSCSLFNLLLWD